MTPKYSVVVPIYNEAAGLTELYRRVRCIIDQMDGSAEIIFVNDGSEDESLSLIKELRQIDFRVCYIDFSRNFGHQVAVTAGLNFARGEAVITMDADLQDPPELILELTHKWQQGYDIVYAKRIRRAKEGFFKRGTAYLFYRFLKRMADVEIPTDVGDFCLMDEKVVKVLNSMPERNRYLRGLRAWTGFRQTSVPFKRDPRFAGTVKYTFQKSLKLAIDGLASFSRIPLRVATYIGLLSALVSLLMVILVIYWRLFHPNSSLTGYTIIIAVLFFLGAVQLFSIGILGEYIGRIYEEVKKRPLYTLNEIVGFESYTDKNFVKKPNHIHEIEINK
ncbi:glycosyltransferase family 2 protein [Nodosilinea sp. P-1105]|uniref:glycosyltransferase family 2 protein n=1 Tax=Nodosilinea sp. P-1105 TaxID=2546229 RepID=UPI00146A21BA|nr:glycosyltransferase family 2 protein [Nodosilinea sp. P-1105]NMF85919.1 glycosyltransferase [Nodosilinea sp. P-1105]